MEETKRREDEWFKRNEQQLLEAARAARARREQERAAQERAEERAKIKALHFMKCPKCGHDMEEEDFEGVKVDRCSFCEGIYLDAGELDQLFLKKEDDRRGFLRRMIGI